MAIFDSIKDLVSRAKENETAYICMSDKLFGYRTERFLKTDQVHFHDQNAILEYREDNATQFFHAIDCDTITVHFVAGDLLNYIKQDLPKLWSYLDEEQKENIKLGQPFILTE